jgi:hypothetical protein
MVRFVIFSGANERAIVAACRYFTRQRLAYSLIARPDVDKIRLTAFSAHIASTRSRAALEASDMLAQVAALKQRYPNDRLVYLPTAESVNRMLLAQREDFEQAGLNVGLVDEETYRLISDKFSFQEYAARYGIATPEIIAEGDTARFPFVAKPRQEFSSVDGGKIYPHLIFSPQDYARFTASEDKADFFFQRYISGQSYYYLFFFPTLGQPVVAYQKNLLQQSGGKSIIYAESCACPDKNFEIKLVTLLQTLKFQGFIMIEAIKDNNDTVIIEANPRLWGPYELAIAQGLTPDLLISDCPLAVKENKRAGYLWLNGLWLTFAKGEKPKCYGSLARVIFGVGKHIADDIYLHPDSLAVYRAEIKQAFISSVQTITGWCRHVFTKK